MQTIFAKKALLGDRWVTHARLVVSDGRILSVTEAAAQEPSDQTVDTLLPAIANVHSHSFQRAMAGMTEHRVRDRESFWTWREVMYRFLDHLTPDDIEAIAAQAFVEMLEAGFSAVGEFHYVHHQPGGRPYDRVGELSERIMAAASTTGIGLTHLPVLYRQGGVDQTSLQGGQLRFGNTMDQFSKLFAACEQSMKHLPSDARLGVAPHSLRAVSAEDIACVPDMARGAPIHIHIAEQVKEVEDVQKAYGAKPVEWLLNNLPVDRNWCAIHATHMTGEEASRLAKSGAIAGLCPITEANLGDGIFDAPAWIAADGAIAVGSDSNVRISLVEELRTLEYGQRLRDRQRNVMSAGQGSTGTFVYRSAAKGGARAVGRHAGKIAQGYLADLVAIDSAHPALVGLKASQLMDGLCFAAPDSVVTDVWSAGRHMVKSGQHVAREAIAKRYRNVVIQLRSHF